MQKKFRTIITLALLIVLATAIFPNNFVQAKVINSPPMDDPIKPWTIKFNDAVGSNEENLKKIYVHTADNKKIEISYKISADLTEVTVIPKKYYYFDEIYTLVIPMGFESKAGQLTQEDTTMSFQIEKKVITGISATYNNLYTHIIVKGEDSISNVRISINNSETVQLNLVGSHFSKGVLGLIRGDSLTIYAYDQNNTLLETQYYYVK